MLPQDPTLFSGSVRENLDPFKEHSDGALLEALAKAQLREAFQEQGKSLDTDVGEGGGSLSVGQRQLLCFARAMLRGSSHSSQVLPLSCVCVCACVRHATPRSLCIFALALHSPYTTTLSIGAVLTAISYCAGTILVMDECTANVDVETDALLQQMARPPSPPTHTHARARARAHTRTHAHTLTCMSAGETEAVERLHHLHDCSSAGHGNRLR